VYTGVHEDSSTESTNKFSAEVEFPKKSILFTGGGSAGHVVPNLALIDVCLEKKIPVSYMGSEKGIERTLIAPLNIPYYPIATGKLRRYLSLQNLLDPFKVFLGIFQAWQQLGKIKPGVVFSKGGFVAFPVVFSAWLRGIPVVAHESDATPGLANRLSFPFVKKIAMTFPHSSMSRAKIVITGTPLRDSLFQGDALKGRQICEFDNKKPCLMVIGGGSGAAIINETIRKALPMLLPMMNVIHCCGKGKTLPDFASSLVAEEGGVYKQFEYVNEELPHLYACADLIISRAGANTVYEILALQKPTLFIPLSLQASRGDQIANTNFLVSKDLCAVLDESSLDVDSLIKAIQDLSQKSDDIKVKMQTYGEENKIKEGTETIIQLIQEVICEQ
jgi:UDP-N-acetylglucosamine--N-acetylmuramyl-(pentapeptide) pyrophosphoryl-undecaprenol N-acetylglucosamine transferase